MPNGSPDGNLSNRDNGMAVIILRVDLQQPSFTVQHFYSQIIMIIMRIKLYVQ